MVCVCLCVNRTYATIDIPNEKLLQNQFTGLLEHKLKLYDTKSLYRVFYLTSTNKLGKTSSHIYIFDTFLHAGPVMETRGNAWSANLSPSLSCDFLCHALFPCLSTCSLLTAEKLWKQPNQRLLCDKGDTHTHGPYGCHWESCSDIGKNPAGCSPRSWRRKNKCSITYF